MLLIRGLVKRYGRRVVLPGVDLAFPAGQITAVVGPNAAGKSTLLKCVLGLARPDRGEVLLDGRRLNGDPSLRRALGYMPQQPAFPEHLTGAEVLRLVSALRGDEAPEDEDLFEAFRLRPALGTPVRAMSGGTRQKLSAAVAFLYRPRLLVLDEPTAGLDPVASGALKEKIAEAARRGATVLLTSHLLPEMEELADRVVYLVEGEVRFDGTREALRRLTGEPKLERAVARLMRERAA